MNGSPAAQRRAAVLRAMGLAPLWRLRSRAEERARAEDGAGSQAQAEAPAALADAAVSAPAARTDEPDSGAHSAHLHGLDWDALEQAMRACQACALGEQRTQAVPGVGDRKARWLLVGEAPGRDEDLRGEPFVGAAGQLLDRMLAAIGLRRGEDVYIANALKCRPPRNRTPQAEEVARCLPFLHRQIELLQPELILALGRPAALALLGTEVSIAAARGRLFHPAAGGPPVVVTYHPAYLLRNPQDKAKAWEDLCFARRTIAALRTTP